MKKLIILLFLIQACSADGYDKSLDFRLSNKQSKSSESAIILTMVNAEYFNDGEIKRRFDTDFNEINWCEYDDKVKCKEILYFNPYTKKKFYDLYNFYVVDPGLYYANQFKQSPTHNATALFTVPTAFVLAAILGPSAGGFFPVQIPNFTSYKSGWNKKLNAPNFASFEAKAREIVYIGDLFFTFTKQQRWIKGKINLEVQDNYDQAVSYFRTQYPEYKDKPVIKRLAKPGVLLDDYDAGIFW